MIRLNVRVQKKIYQSGVEFYTAEALTMGIFAQGDTKGQAINRLYKKLIESRRILNQGDSYTITWDSQMMEFDLDGQETGSLDDNAAAHPWEVYRCPSCKPSSSLLRKCNRCRNFYCEDHHIRNEREETYCLECKERVRYPLALVESL